MICTRYLAAPDDVSPVSLRGVVQVCEALCISTCAQMRGLLVRHLGRALRMTVLLREALEALPSIPPAALKDRCAVLSQDATLLARTLITEHYIVDPSSGLYNPQYLTFEFASGFPLRKRQVEIVEDIVSAVHRGESCVHQMIMGAGKTTMIMPLIALALADGTLSCPARLFAPRLLGVVRLTSSCAPPSQVHG